MMHMKKIFYFLTLMSFFIFVGVNDSFAAEKKAKAKKSKSPTVSNTRRFSGGAAPFYENVIRRAGNLPIRGFSGGNFIARLRNNKALALQGQGFTSKKSLWGAAFILGANLLASQSNASSVEDTEGTVGVVTVESNPADQLGKWISQDVENERKKQKAEAAQANDKKPHSSPQPAQ